MMKEVGRQPVAPGQGEYLHWGSQRSIIWEAASSQPFSASGPAMFVATTTEKPFYGASHITTYHMLFEPLCIKAVPPAQPRRKTTQPQA